MESKHFALHIAILLIIFATLGTAKPTSQSVITASNEQGTAVLNSSIDCSSKDLTIDQLKTIASNVSCPENNDRRFWESACKCVVKTLPHSKCPQCRYARNVESNSSSSNAENQPTTPSTFTYPSTKLTTTSTEDKESTNKKLRMMPTNNNGTAAAGGSGNSANFIRFGK